MKMKILCPISTIISPEEFCQIAGISRERYELDRSSNKISRNNSGVALKGADGRFHNVFDVLQYELLTAMNCLHLTEVLEDSDETCEEILDRLASILESEGLGEAQKNYQIVEGCRYDPLLFALTGKTNEAFGVYRRIGLKLQKTENILNGRFYFRLSLSNAIDEESGEWASNVWLNLEREASITEVVRQNWTAC
jgi:hypothetical protein